MLACPSDEHKLRNSRQAATHTKDVAHKCYFFDNTQFLGEKKNQAFPV